MMGLDYATGGTMSVAGKKLVVIEKDDQGKPDVGKSLLAAAYGDDKADIAVGPTSSGVALALPVAEEYKKILLVEPAVADSITGDKWNKYIFRTGRNSSQDAISNAVALDKKDTVIATLAQDYAFGRDGVKAFKDAIKTAKIVHEEYLPTNTTDFTAGAQRLIDKLKDQPGRKVIFVIWAGAGNPFKIADLDLKRYGIEIATGGNILPAMAAYKNFPGMEGATYYYFGIPKNPVNEWLVANHYKQFKNPPDFFTAGGMSAAIAVVEALKKTAGDTNTDKLIKTMEGMSFGDAEKGKMTLPRPGPPGHAVDVPLQDQGGPGLRLGRAGAGARDQARGDGRSPSATTLTRLRRTVSRAPVRPTPCAGNQGPHDPLRRAPWPSMRCRAASSRAR